MRRTNRIAVAILNGAIVLAGTAAADLLSTPQPGSSNENPASPAFEILYDFGSKTRYDSDISGYGNIGFNVKRKTVLARLSYGDFFLSGGVTYDARIEQRAGIYYPMPMEGTAAYGYPRYDEPEDPVGKGFIAAAGLRSMIWKQDRFALHACGQLSFRRESYDATATYVSYPVYAQSSPEILPQPVPPPEPITYTETYDIDLRGTELSAGLVGSFTRERYTVYAGVEFLAYSDMEADVTVTSSDGSGYSDRSDVNRSDLVTLLLGLKASFDRGFVLVETRALGESNLRVGAGVTF